MKAFYCDHFVLPLPVGHRFPMEKYSLLRRGVLERNILRDEDLVVPQPVSNGQMLLVHTRDYVNAVVSGQLTDGAQRRIGFPWSPQLVERSRRSVGGTLAACRAALRDGVAVNLAGGTHHAFADRGEGFCVLNDAAIAIRVLQSECVITRALVVDCDVHQGNGTASIFRDDPTVFTFSVHGRNNYPFRKEESNIDVPLADGVKDSDYLDRVAEFLDQILGAATFDLAIYVAGADPFAEDRLGRLALSKAGLVARDRLVFHRLANHRIPTAVVMAGGYAKNVLDTVDIHLATVHEAQHAWRVTYAGR